jgi:hypothetical protein
MEAIIVAIITSICAPLVLNWLNTRKERKDERFADLAKQIDEVSMGNLRLQILNLIQHDPQNKSAILSLWDEYKSRGGNSYLKDVVKQWQKNRK